MKKVLFVSRDYTAKGDGGSAVAQRNLSFLKALGVEVAELTIGTPSLLTRLKNVLLRESYGDTGTLRRQLRHHLTKDYDFVFFDGAFYGVYLREFARHGFKTICFFHNVEAEFYRQKYENTRKIQDRVMVGFITHNELCCIQYASYLIALNERDSHKLNEIYHRSADFLLPTSFDDIDESKEVKRLDLPEHFLLFVGSNFFANREAIDFYAKEIAPSTQLPLIVAGNLSEAYPDKEAHPNIRFVGRVSDLAPYYVQASAVVAPVLSGSGLKTKTVEALRYGKFVIGSPEAFQGVPIDNYPEAGRVCQSPSEYIQQINHLNVSKFNEPSIRLFEDYFSTNTQLRRFKDFIQRISQ